MLLRKVWGFAIAGTIAFLCALPGAAGTTGGLHGRVTDVDSGQPIAAVSVTVVSPSQSATAVSSASGAYDFLSLAPDTYTLTAKKDGYNLEQVPGITIISDQVRAVNVRMQKALRTIGKVAIHSSAGLVRSGVVSDVYSVNAVTQKAAAPLAGAGALNQAYGAIATAPGVNYDQGQQGWYQNIYIRGGDIDQVAYEFDGVPVIRESDDGAVTTLTNLGQAEVQVYAGGTPASADAPGLAGYINQVVKTGTYPGYANMSLGIGGPALYNKSMIEAAGSTPDHLFSYYVGTQYVSQGNRFGDQFNGASNPLYFYPLAYGNPFPSPSAAASGAIATPLNTTVPDGSAQWLWAPGPTNAIARITDQETIANFHIGLSHKHDPGKDDIQLLYDNSLIVQKFYGSIQDQITQNVQTAFGGQVTYFDGVAYNGQVGAPPQPGLVAPDLFPNSPQQRQPFALLPINEREGSQNGVALTKFQYTRNINSQSFLRFDAYTDYAIWFITGPVSANLVYGGQLPDYEVNEHKYGGKLDYSNQLSEKNLLEATISYLTAHLETISGQFATFLDYAEPTTNLVDSAGNCYAYATGQLASCFPAFPPAGYPNQVSQGCISFCSSLTPGTPPAGSPAALAGAQWLVTEPGSHAQIDTVKPYFYGYSVNDQWRPNDKLTMNLGVRLDQLNYRLDDLATGYPARAFWFHAFNNEFCFATGLPAPVQRTFNAAGVESPCPAGTSPTQLVNFPGGTDFQSLWQPRFGATYNVSPDLVLRATYGRYIRPASTSYHEYNTIQQDLPLFISTFLNMGYNSPIHDIHADTASNYDFSVEQHFHGTDMSYKLTPFYRATQGQLQFTSLNAQGVLAAINAGQQTSQGIELAFTKGNFARDGWAIQLGTTYLDSTIKYGPQPNGQNVIDILNNYIEQYNSFTSACAGAGGSQAICGIYGNGNAKATFTNTATGVVTPNPYYGQATQPLLDRNARYTTYSVIPSPFNNANGFATPFDSTLIINYRHKTWNVSPTFTFSDGEKYGSPLVWPGYDPSTCGNPSALTTPSPDTTPAGCSGFIFIPDKYTGAFDTLGAFQQPPRLTMSLALGWQPTNRLGATFTVTSLIDHCWQRGFPWDSATTCVYAQLPSNLLSPGGNFLPNPPIQLAYPYGSWYNNTEIGQEGQKSPTSYSFEMNFKL